MAGINICKTWIRYIVDTCMVKTIVNIPRQSIKKFTFCVKSSDLIFFLLGLSPIVNLSLLRGKYCLISLEIVKIPTTLSCFK